MRGEAGEHDPPAVAGLEGGFGLVLEAAERGQRPEAVHDDRTVAEHHELVGRDDAAGVEQNLAADEFEDAAAEDFSAAPPGGDGVGIDELFAAPATAEPAEVDEASPGGLGSQRTHRADQAGEVDHGLIRGGDGEPAVAGQFHGGDCRGLDPGSRVLGLPIRGASADDAQGRQAREGAVFEDEVGFVEVGQAGEVGLSSREFQGSAGKGGPLAGFELALGVEVHRGEVELDDARADDAAAAFGGENGVVGESVGRPASAQSAEIDDSAGGGGGPEGTANRGESAEIDAGLVLGRDREPPVGRQGDAGHRLGLQEGAEAVRGPVRVASADFLQGWQTDHRPVGEVEVGVVETGEQGQIRFGPRDDQAPLGEGLPLPGRQAFRVVDFDRGELQVGDSGGVEASAAVDGEDGRVDEAVAAPQPLQASEVDGALGGGGRPERPAEGDEPAEVDVSRVFGGHGEPAVGRQSDAGQGLRFNQGLGAVGGPVRVPPADLAEGREADHRAGGGFEVGVVEVGESIEVGRGAGDPEAAAGEGGPRGGREGLRVVEFHVDEIEFGQPASEDPAASGGGEDAAVGEAVGGPPAGESGEIDRSRVGGGGGGGVRGGEVRPEKRIVAPSSALSGNQPEVGRVTLVTARASISEPLPEAVQVGLRPPTRVTRESSNTAPSETRTSPSQVTGVPVMVRRTSGPSPMRVASPRTREMPPRRGFPVGDGEAPAGQPESAVGGEAADAGVSGGVFDGAEGAGDDDFVQGTGEPTGVPVGGLAPGATVAFAGPSDRGAPARAAGDPEEEDHEREQERGRVRVRMGVRWCHDGGCSPGHGLPCVGRTGESVLQTRGIGKGRLHRPEPPGATRGCRRAGVPPASGVERIPGGTKEDAAGVRSEVVVGPETSEAGGARSGRDGRGPRGRFSPTASGFRGTSGRVAGKTFRPGSRSRRSGVNAAVRTGAWSVVGSPDRGGGAPVGSRRTAERKRGPAPFGTGPRGRPRSGRDSRIGPGYGLTRR
jgi:hypothetical protein